MNDQDEVSADREDVSLVGRHSRTPSSDGAVVLDGGDGCHQEPVPANFFDKRGISSEVMQAQGYIRYEKGDAGPLQQAWPHHRRFAAEIANQCGGWVIPRYAPQGLGLGPVSAQVRPDDDVEIDRHPHYHGTDPKPVYPDEHHKAGDPLPLDWILTGAARQAHIDSEKAPRRRQRRGTSRLRSPSQVCLRAESADRTAQGMAARPPDVLRRQAGRSTQPPRPALA
jgi:hypothetical protein